MRRLNASRLKDHGNVKVGIKAALQDRVVDCCVWQPILPGIVYVSRTNLFWANNDKSFIRNVPTTSF